MNEINLKILLCGDSSVGKTSLLLKYTDNYFPELHISTIGVEYKIKELNINGRKVILRIWDTSGQERYRSITQNFYRNANGILFVFDLTNKVTFDNIKNWLTDSQNFETKVIKILVGNKSDLIEERKVDQDSVERYADKKEMQYYETSAKDGNNVDKAFRELAELILENKTDEEIKEQYLDNTKNTSSFNLSMETKPKEKKKKGCC
jgi:Ras-related protein Rab-1A